MNRLDPHRATVLAEARSWLGTPYHHMGRIRGAGTDCLMLLVEVYSASGIIPPVSIPFYPPDWHLHRGTERYLDGVMQYASEVAKAEPGDVALFKFGRCFAHGAIVVKWPRLIHAWHNAGVVYGDAIQAPLAPRAVRFFNPF
jgi:NlpC/P60 family putative phage cell wall peptidase